MPKIKQIKNDGGITIFGKPLSIIDFKKLKEIFKIYFDEYLKTRK